MASPNDHLIHGVRLRATTAERRAQAAEARVAELEAALRRVMEESGTSQMQYKIAQAALKGKGVDE